MTQPIFTAVRPSSGMRLAKAPQKTALLVYQRSIQAAFRSVSDAFVAYRKTREFREQEELLVRSAQDATRLSHMRYTGGVTRYLEDLTNENAQPPCTCAGIVIGIESLRSVIRDHEVCELPGILVGFDLDLLLLLVHGQSACRQHGAGTLAIGGKQQLNSPNTVFPGPRSVV